MSGGAHTSRTIMLRELETALSVCSSDATLDDYRREVIEANVTGKNSMPARQRTFRYLRELYALDPSVESFRVLKLLWDHDASGHPLLAMLSALHRDAALRGTAPAILRTRPGEPVSADNLAQSVEQTHRGDYNAAVVAKIGRNALSSWSQSGHLRAIKKTAKLRTIAHATPATAVYALYLGHLDGRAGQALLDTLYMQVLDAPFGEIRELAFTASALGWLEYHEAGDIVEVGFRWLTKGAE